MLALSTVVAAAIVWGIEVDSEGSEESKASKECKESSKESKASKEREKKALAL